MYTVYADAEPYHREPKLQASLVKNFHKVSVMKSLNRSQPIRNLVNWKGCRYCWKRMQLLNGYWMDPDVVAGRRLEGLERRC